MLKNLLVFLFANSMFCPEKGYTSFSSIKCEPGMFNNELDSSAEINKYAKINAFHWKFHIEKKSVFKINNAPNNHGFDQQWKKE